jgi:hypothetical protein
MTPLQWLFHYYEIMTFKKHENELKIQEQELNARRFDLFMDRLEVLWLTTNPHLGKELLESKNQSKIKQSEDGITPENFQEEWAKMLKVIPREIKKPSNLIQRGPSLPKFSKERLRARAIGLQIEHPDNTEG